MAERCRAGADVQLDLLEGVGHVDAGPEATPQVLEWIADRFAGRPTRHRGLGGGATLIDKGEQ